MSEYGDICELKRLLFGSIYKLWQLFETCIACNIPFAPENDIMPQQELLKYILSNDDVRHKTSLRQLAFEHFKSLERSPHMLCDFYAILNWLLCRLDKLDQLAPFSHLHGDNLQLYSEIILSFVQLLQKSGVEPVFFILPPPGYDSEQLKTKFADIKSQIFQKRAEVSSIHQVCAGVKCTVELNVTDFAALHVESVLNKAGAKMLHLTAELVNEIERYYCDHKEVCGVLTNNVDLLVVNGLKLFLPELLEIRKVQNSDPPSMEVSCQFVTSTMLASSLKISEAQLPDLVFLCENMYQICSLLRLHISDVAAIAQWLRGRKKSVQNSKELKKFFTMSRLWRYNVELSKTSARTAENATIIGFVRTCIQRGTMLSHLLALANGEFLRPIISESLQLKGPCFVLFTLNIRKQLYSLLGVKKFVEYGCSSTRSFCSIYGKLKPCLSEKNELVSLTEKPLSIKLSLLFKTVLGQPLKLTDDSSMLQLDSIEQVHITAVIVCSCLLFMSCPNDIYTPSPELAVCELDALLLTCLLPLTGSPVPTLTSCPTSRSLTVNAWFTHLLHHSLLVSSLLQLTELLPSPGDIFSSLTFITFHKASFVQDEATAEENVPLSEGASEIISASKLPIVGHVTGKDSASLPSVDHAAGEGDISSSAAVEQYRTFMSLQSVLRLRAEILNCEEVPTQLTPFVKLFVEAVEAIKSAAPPSVRRNVSTLSAADLLPLSKPPNSLYSSFSSQCSTSTISRLEVSEYQDTKELEQDWYSFQDIQEEAADGDHSDEDILERPSPAVPKSSEEIAPNAIATSQPDGADPVMDVVPSSSPKKKKRSTKRKQRFVKTATTVPLPILEHKKQILDLVSTHRVVMIEGETGCGKSTKVPQFILDSCLREKKQCVIMVTQPRRVAAIKLAERVAGERGEEVGKTVGFCIGGESHRTTKTALTYCTIGYLLQMLLHNPEMIQTFTHIILDEIHERSISTEFTLLVIRKFAVEYPDMKILLMSATLQGPLFVSYFDQVLPHTVIAKPYFVGATRFKVETYFLDSITQLTDKMTVGHNKQLQAASNLRTLISDMPKKSAYDLRKTRPTVTELALSVCTELVINQGNKGESILIFLPGIGEILSYRDRLLHELQDRDIGHYYSCFVLHSQVPLEEQTEVFSDPPPNRVHVIMATNIAESSLTLPKLRLVINFGLYRQLQYDSKRGLSCLRKLWCSQAACAQRTGRVGRVFDGAIVHLFTLRFFQIVLPEYTPPEIVTAPLSKLVLQAKSIATKLGMSTPSEVLSQALEPPSLEQMETALQDLANLGAIVSHPQKRLEETASMTVLGDFCLSLPMDVDLCRLVLYGIYFGVSTEAIVIAAELSQTVDVFTLPTRCIITDKDEFRAAMARSLDTRIKYDGGHFSDHLMVCQMFQEWIDFRKSNAQRSKPVSKYVLVRDFCKGRAIRCTRLLLLETSVAHIASRLLSCVPVESEIYESIEALSTLNRYVEHLQLETVLFCSDPILVKCLLTASFSHQMILGGPENCSNFPLVQKDAKAEIKFMEECEVDPAKCVVMRNLPQMNSQDLYKLIDWLLPGTRYETEIKDRKTAFINFPMLEPCNCCRETSQEQTTQSCVNCNVPDNWKAFMQERSVFSRKVPREFYTLWQFGERQSSWNVETISASFSRVEHPLSISWENISQRREMVGITSFRNPSAFACDFNHKNIPRLAVVTSLQGGEHATFIHARKMTILPSIETSPVALLCALGFQPLCSDVGLQVERETRTITGLKFNSQQILFGAYQALTVQDIIRLNVLRKAVSEALTCTNSSGVLPITQINKISSLLKSVISRVPLPIDSSAQCQPSRPIGPSVAWERQQLEDWTIDSDCDSEFDCDLTETPDVEVDISSFKFYPDISCSLLDSVCYSETEAQNVMIEGNLTQSTLPTVVNDTQCSTLSPLAEPFVPVIYSSGTTDAPVPSVPPGLPSGDGVYFNMPQSASLYLSMQGLNLDIPMTLTAGEAARYFEYVSVQLFQYWARKVLISRLKPPSQASHKSPPSQVSPLSQGSQESPESQGSPRLQRFQGTQQAYKGAQRCSRPNSHHLSPPEQQQRSLNPQRNYGRRPLLQPYSPRFTMETGQRLPRSGYEQSNWYYPGQQMGYPRQAPPFFNTWRPESRRGHRQHQRPVSQMTYPQFASTHRRHYSDPPPQEAHPHTPHLHLSQEAHPDTPHPRTSQEAHPHPLIELEPSQVAHPHTLLDESEPSQVAHPHTLLDESEPSQVAHPLTLLDESEPSQVTHPHILLEPSQVAHPHTLLIESEPSQVAHPYTVLDELEPSQVAHPHTLLIESEPSQVTHPHILLDESQPSQVAHPHTLLIESEPSQVAHPHTLLDELEPSQVAHPHTLLIESEPSQVAHTLLDESEPSQVAHPHTVLDESEPSQVAHPHTLLDESQPSQVAHPHTLLDESEPPREAHPHILDRSDSGEIASQEGLVPSDSEAPETSSFQELSNLEPPVKVTPDGNWKIKEQSHPEETVASKKRRKKKERKIAARSGRRSTESQQYPPRAPPPRIFPKTVDRFESPRVCMNPPFSGVLLPSSVRPRNASRMPLPRRPGNSSRYNTPSIYQNLVPPLPMPLGSGVITESSHLPEAFVYLSWKGQVQPAQSRVKLPSQTFPDYYGITNKTLVGYFVRVLYWFYKKAGMNSLCCYFYYRYLESCGVATGMCAPLDPRFFAERNSHMFRVFSDDSGKKWVSLTLEGTEKCTKILMSCSIQPLCSTREEVAAASIVSDSLDLPEAASEASMCVNSSQQESGTQNSDSVALIDDSAVTAELGPPQYHCLGTESNEATAVTSGDEQTINSEPPVNESPALEETDCLLDDSENEVTTHENVIGSTCEQVAEHSDAPTCEVAQTVSTDYKVVDRELDETGTPIPEGEDTDVSPRIDSVDGKSSQFSPLRRISDDSLPYTEGNQHKELCVGDSGHREEFGEEAENEHATTENDVIVQLVAELLKNAVQAAMTDSEAIGECLVPNEQTLHDSSSIHHISTIAAPSIPNIDDQSESSLEILLVKTLIAEVTQNIDPESSDRELDEGDIVQAHHEDHEDLEKEEVATANAENKDATTEIDVIVQFLAERFINSMKVAEAAMTDSEAIGESVVSNKQTLHDDLSAHHINTIVALSIPNIDDQSESSLEILPHFAEVTRNIDPESSDRELDERDIIHISALLNDDEGVTTIVEVESDTLVESSLPRAVTLTDVTDIDSQTDSGDFANYELDDEDEAIFVSESEESTESLEIAPTNATSVELFTEDAQSDQSECSDSEVDEQVETLENMESTEPVEIAPTNATSDELFTEDAQSDQSECSDSELDEQDETLVVRESVESTEPVEIAPTNATSDELYTEDAQSDQSVCSDNELDEQDETLVVRESVESTEPVEIAPTNATSDERFTEDAQSDQSECSDSELDEQDETLVVRESVESTEPVEIAPTNATSDELFTEDAQSDQSECSDSELDEQDETLVMPENMESTEPVEIAPTNATSDELFTEDAQSDQSECSDSELDEQDETLVVRESVESTEPVEIAPTNARSDEDAQSDQSVCSDSELDEQVETLVVRESEESTEPVEIAPTNATSDELFTEDAQSDQSECSDSELDETLVVRESVESTEPVEIAPTNATSDELYTEDAQSDQSECSDNELDEQDETLVVRESVESTEPVEIAPTNATSDELFTAENNMVVETSSTATTDDEVIITESSLCVSTDSERSDRSLDKTVVMLEMELTEPEPVSTLCAYTGDSTVLVASSLETTPPISAGSHMKVGEELVTGASLSGVVEAIKCLNPVYVDVFEELSVTEYPAHQDSALGIQESYSGGVIEGKFAKAMEADDELTIDTAQNTDIERSNCELDGEDVMLAGETEGLISHSPASADSAGIILAAGCTHTGSQDDNTQLNTEQFVVKAIDYRGGDHQESATIDTPEPNKIDSTVTSNEELVEDANEPLVDCQPVKASASKCDGTASLFKLAIGDIVCQKSAQSTRRVVTSPSTKTLTTEPHISPRRNSSDSNVAPFESVTSTCSVSALAISQSSSPDTSTVLTSAASIDVESQLDDYCWIKNPVLASSQEEVDDLAASPVRCKPPTVIVHRHGSGVVSKRPTSQQERKKRFRSVEGESSSSRNERSEQSEISQSKQEDKPLVGRRWAKYPASMSQWETLDMLPHQQEDTGCKTEVTAPSKEQRKTTSAGVAMDGKKSVVGPTSVGTIPHFISYAENAVLASVEGKRSFFAICILYRKRYRIRQRDNVRFRLADIVGKSKVFSVVKKQNTHPFLVQVESDADPVSARLFRDRDGERGGKRQEKRQF